LNQCRWAWNWAFLAYYISSKLNIQSIFGHVFFFLIKRGIISKFSKHNILGCPLDFPKIPLVFYLHSFAINNIYERYYLLDKLKYVHVKFKISQDWKESKRLETIKNGPHTILSLTRMKFKNSKVGCCWHKSSWACYI